MRKKVQKEVEEDGIEILVTMTIGPEYSRKASYPGDLQGS